ncbi:cupin domain-containing protein [Alkalibacterium putridalgicola]|uniref:cupin domain-containing protein n=1 Tax=Alkalibacterium putridalgicola TaxID=426703 RepID=UPI0034CE3CE5
MKTAEQWISELNLEPHPEDGYFRQTELSDETYEKNGKDFALYTSIYFLLTTDSPSHFHRLVSDEMWFYHAGHPLTVHSLLPDGSYKKTTLSLDIEQGHHLHHTVPAGTIFGSTVETGYALVSCTVVPGFDFSDFRLFTKKELLEKYPEHSTIIKRLAYDTLPE